MLLPVVLVCLAPLVPAFSGQQAPKLRIGKLAVGANAVLFAGVIAALLIFEPPYLKPLYTNQSPPSLRQDMEPATERLRATIGEKRLWVFLPNDVENGFVGRIFRFLLSPGYTWVEENPDALLVNAAKLKDELRNFDFAWFVAQNDEIDAAAQALVGEPLATRVFRIDRTAEEILFEPVPDAFEARN
jgi:hypothetical protein